MRAGAGAAHTALLSPRHTRRTVRDGTPAQITDRELTYRDEP